MFFFPAITCTRITSICTDTLLLSMLRCSPLKTGKRFLVIVDSDGKHRRWSVPRYVSLQASWGKNVDPRTPVTLCPGEAAKTVKWG